MEIRKSVYGLPAGDKTIEWYARAIAEMKTRSTSDPTSWAYLGAIHGLSHNPERNQYWKQYAPFPPKSEVDDFWEKCQHQTWYFLPWHRMYLAYFEQIVAETIQDLGGPSDWALPFWNYSDTANPRALDIPSQFTSPANASNSLWMPNRHNQVDQSSVTLNALEKELYTTVDFLDPEYGGPETKFSHDGESNGALESLPHNHIHVDISGAMGNPDTAGLDPIFWLHHANIDRLWQIWLNQGGGRINPDEKNWLDFKFNFHNKNSQPVKITPREVEDTRLVLSGYVYEGVPPSAPTTKDKKFAAPAARRAPIMPLEVVDATQEKHHLKGEPSRVALSFGTSKQKRQPVAKSFSDQRTVKKRTVLRFENIKGKGLVPVHSVFIEAPNKQGEIEAHFVGSLALFGLERSSGTDEHHSGSGLSEHFNITDVLDLLQSSEQLNLDKLNVLIKPNRAMPDDVSVSVGRISLYSE
ncbi:MAG: tyrosinase family protein [Flavobacteriaceae bacterium]|nr:tyrosinase family protein [Flavobacteriaceae bacterium]